MSNQTGKRIIRRVRNRKSDEDFINEQLLESNRQWAHVFTTLIFIVAAVTTFSFGLLGSWGDVVLADLPPREFWRVVWRGIGAAVIVTALLDGCRLGWRWARLAAKTMPGMQWLSGGLEALTFCASLGVSMLGLPPLLTYLGLDLFYDPALISLVLTYVLQISLGTNLLAAFIYIMLSPESMKLMQVAHLASKREAMYLTKFSKMLQDVQSGESSEIEEFLTPIAADWIQQGAANFLSQNGYEQLASPPPAGGDGRGKRRHLPMREPVGSGQPEFDPPTDEEIRYVGGILGHDHPEVLRAKSGGSNLSKQFWTYLLYFRAAREKETHGGKFAGSLNGSGD